MNEQPIKSNLLKTIRLHTSIVCKSLFMLALIFAIVPPIKSFAYVTTLTPSVTSYTNTVGLGQQIRFVTNDKDFFGSKSLRISSTTPLYGTVSYNTSGSMTLNNTTDITITGVNFSKNASQNTSETTITLTLRNTMYSSNITYSITDAQQVSATVNTTINPSKMEITQNIASPSTNGGQFSTQPKITLYDANGNICTNDNASIVTASKNDSGSWTLTGTLTATAVNGVATFTNLGSDNNQAVSGAQLKFTRSGVADVLSSAVTLPVKVLPVTFKDYDGSIIATQSVNYGNTATAPTDPTRTGYTFTGWDVPFNNITADTIVTAQYSINSYTVTFNSYDGMPLKTESVNYGSSATAPLVPGRLEYAFTGWDKTFDNITADTTVTAQYSIRRYTLTIKNVENNGSTVTNTYDASSKVSASTKVPTDKYFVGWQDETGSIISYYKNYNFILTSNKILTATFSDQPVNVVPTISLDDDVIMLNVDDIYGKMYFTSTIAGPTGYTPSKCGVEMSTSNNTFQNITKDLESTVEKNSAGQFYSIFNVFYDHTLYVRSYIIDNGIRIYSPNIVEVKMTKQQKE